MTLIVVLYLAILQFILYLDDSKLIYYRFLFQEQLPPRIKKISLNRIKINTRLTLITYIFVAFSNKYL